MLLGDPNSTYTSFITSNCLESNMDKSFERKKSMKDILMNKSNTMKKLSLALFVVLCSLSLTAHTASFHSKTEGVLWTTEDDSLLGRLAPGFELLGMDGQLCTLEKLKGKVVVLNFWFRNCKPCVNEMPTLNSIKERYDPSNVVFLALTFDTKDEVGDFLRTHAFSFKILPNAGLVANEYGIAAYPASMVIDRKGIVRFVQVGGPDIDKTLPSAIDKAVK